MVYQTAEPVLLLDQATRTRIRAALRNYRGGAWAPQGIDRQWWSEFAKGRVEAVPVSRFRIIAAWFPAVRIVL